LLRCLSGDPTEIVRRVSPLFDDVAIFVEFLAIDEDLAGVRVDRDACFLRSAGGALVRGDECVCERVEDRVRGDTLLPLQELQRV